jgi:hypothetical protein
MVGDSPTTGNWLNNMPRFQVIVLVLALSAFFAYLRLFQISESPIGMDESFTALYASKPWGELWHFVNENDVHPPLYFAFTRMFRFLGGDAYALRFPAAIASIFSLPVLYLAGTLFGAAGKDQIDRFSGLVALTLGGMATVLIIHAQTARAYSLIFLGFALVTFGASYLLRNKLTASTPFWRPNGRAGIPAFLSIVLGLLVMLWSHNVGVIYATAISLTLVVFWLLVLRANGGAFLNLMAAALLVAVGWTPQLMTLVEQWGAVSSDYWIQEPTLRGLVAIFLSTLGDAEEIKELRPQVIVFAALIFVLAGWALFRMIVMRNVGQTILALGLVAGPATILIAVTYLARPVLLDRTAMPLIAPWIVVVASGIAALPQAALRNGVLLVCLALGGMSTVSHLRADPGHEEPWPQIIQAIQKNSAGRPMVLVIPNAAAIPLAYHISESHAEIDVVPIPGPFPVKSDDRRYPTGWPGVPGVNTEALTEVDGRIAKARGDVWLLLRGHWIYDPDALLRYHFDQNYCYQPLYVPQNKYLFALKLVPLEEIGKIECVKYASHDYYPFEKPDAGLVQLGH